MPSPHILFTIPSQPTPFPIFSPTFHHTQLHIPFAILSPLIPFPTVFLPFPQTFTILPLYPHHRPFALYPHHNNPSQNIHSHHLPLSPYPHHTKPSQTPSSPISLPRLATLFTFFSLSTVLCAAVLVQWESHQDTSSFVPFVPPASAFI